MKNRITTLVAAGMLAVAGTGMAAVCAPSATADRASVQTNDTVYFEVSYSGYRIRYEGGSHANDVSVDVGDTDIVIVDNNAVGLSASSQCTVDSLTQVTCPKDVGSGSADKVFNISILGNDGDDTLTSSGYGLVSGSSQPIKVTLAGWGGDDTLVATGGYSGITGGPGDDDITSGPGTSGYNEYIYGQDGNDTIHTDGDSTDLDRIYCDDNLDLGYTDVVHKENQDIIMGYPHWPPPALSSGCDTVYSS